MDGLNLAVVIGSVVGICIGILARIKIQRHLAGREASTAKCSAENQGFTTTPISILHGPHLEEAPPMKVLDVTRRAKAVS